MPRLGVGLLGVGSCRSDLSSGKAHASRCPRPIPYILQPVFLGHYGAGLAAKKLAPYTSLGTVIVAVQWIDLLWPSALMLGLERVRVDPGNTTVTPLAFDYYPWTHSLAMVLAWAAIVA